MKKAFITYLTCTVLLALTAGTAVSGGPAATTPGSQLLMLLLNPLPYQWAAPANLPLSINNPLAGTTGNCQGCHDGTSSSVTGNQIINDFTRTHPVGFLYGDALMVRNTDPIKPELATTSSYFIDRVHVGTNAIQNGSSAGWTYTSTHLGSTFDSGYVTCAACHDGHGANNAVNDPQIDAAGNVNGPPPNYYVRAREQGSTLCLSCHKMSGNNTAPGSMAPGGGVNGTFHDITYLGTAMGYFNQDQYQRVCIFCHTPHNAMTVEQTGGTPAPLWNHQVTPLNSPVPYQWATADNMSIGIADPLTGPTRLCLGCHDGMSAIDAHGGSGQANNGTHTLQGPKVINDFTVSHPMGFLYADALAVRNVDPAKPQLATPNNFFIDRILSGSATYTTQKISDKLYSGYLTCSTCHDVHNKNNAVNDAAVNAAGSATSYMPNYFVYAREQGSALCSSCHNMAAITSSIANSSHDINYLAQQKGYYNQDEFQRVCIYCHTPHNAMTSGQTGYQPAPLWNHQVTSLVNPLPYQWQDPTNQSIVIIDPLIGPTRLCLGCHDGMTNVDAHGGVGQRNNGNHVMTGSRIVNDFTALHPVGFLFGDALTVGNSNLKPGLSLSSMFRNTTVTIGSRLYNGFMTCATCHDVHNGTARNFLVGGLTAAELCLSCHTSVNTPYAHHLHDKTAAIGIAITGSGTVTDTNSGLSCSSTCQKDLFLNTPLNFTAQAAPHYRFNGWSGTTCSGTGDCSFTVTGPATIQALFTPDTMTVSASVSGGNGTVSPASQTVSYGNPASITIKPNSGYRIAGITDNGKTAPIANPYIIANVTEPHTVVVTFTATPTITSFTPASGVVGSSVTIRGLNLGGTTAVTFNGVSAMFGANSATSVIATVPPGATTGPITVTAASGTSLPTSSSFKVLPVITDFTPAYGPTGTIVVITGKSFTGATTVKFNTTSATAFTVNSDTQITATVPAGATVGKISVTTPGGTATSGTALFTVSPSITSFSPASGAVGATVTIRGTNLGGATSVKFNGVPAIIGANTTTSITTTVPPGALTGRISVTTTGVPVATDSLTNFLVIPAVTGFSPSFGPVGTTVVITGTSFTGATAVKFNTVAAIAFTVNSDNQITATVPTGATTGKISVTTAGGTGSSAAVYTVSPTITSFTPLTGGVGTGVTITGTNLTGATSVKFNTTDAPFVVVSATSIATSVPVGATTGKISVTTGGGTATSAGTFTVTATPAVPKITSFTPVTGGGIGASVTILGSNFVGTTAVKFNGTPVTTFTVLSNTSIVTAVPPGASTGTISVTGTGGTGTSTASFPVGTTPVAPTITTFTPASGKVGAAITVTGTNLGGVKTASVGGFGATFTVKSATSLSITVPPSAVTGPLSVTTDGGTATSATSFTVTP